MRSTGYIDQSGKYHPGEHIEVDTDTSSTHKGWSHDKQRREHKLDLIQPWINGKPNPEFREMYPEESKNYFI